MRLLLTVGAALLVGGIVYVAVFGVARDKQNSATGTKGSGTDFGFNSQGRPVKAGNKERDAQSA